MNADISKKTDDRQHVVVSHAPTSAIEQRDAGCDRQLLAGKRHRLACEKIRILRASRTGGSTLTGSGTICWIFNAPFHRSIRPSIFYLNQPLRPRCGGFFSNPGQTS
ncbi:hypothetical protein PQR67_37790, partial [Paraburkholderia fungorum]|uniref:hypothetical protein n=1 Tax=Paraburkholderia fungorum TaxID=134537 RepID=UPI0038BA14A1